MRRLAQNNVNSAQRTDQRFVKHWKQALNAIDMPRYEHLAKHFKGGVYVDIGCFNSVMPIILSERYPQSEIHALDFAPQLIEFMEYRFPKVHWHCGSCLKLPFKNESVDYVVLGEIIEHLEDPSQAIREAERILRKDGWLVVSTPLNEGIAQPAIDTEEHMWAFTEDDMKDLLGDSVELDLYIDSCKTIMAWKQK